ncbi:hypothetical protein C8R44DRAFT_869607 [Mycena epipterygia]|nr:hypothetical protein C8R44DRAFT_869607 [Mycena epipterygia]
MNHIFTNGASHLLDIFQHSQPSPLGFFPTLPSLFFGANARVALGLFIALSLGAPLRTSSTMPAFRSPPIRIFLLPFPAALKSPESAGTAEPPANTQTTISLFSLHVLLRA